MPVQEKLRTQQEERQMVGEATGRTGWCTMRKIPRGALEMVCHRWVTASQDGAKYCHQCTYWWHEYTESQPWVEPRLSWRHKRELKRVGLWDIPFKPRKLA